MMIKKVKNISPKVTFLTTNGKRTPTEIWLNTENGFRGMTKKSVIKHEEMMQSIGITNDMTDEEIVEYLKNKLDIEKVKG